MSLFVRFNIGLQLDLCNQAFSLIQLRFTFNAMTNYKSSMKRIFIKLKNKAPQAGVEPTTY